MKQAAAEDELEKIATMSVEAEEKPQGLAKQVMVSEIAAKTLPQSKEEKSVPAAATTAPIPAKTDGHPLDDNCNPRQAAALLGSPESMSETIFQTPEQSLEEEGFEGQLEALLREQDVVKDIGLPLTLGLLEVEIQRIGQAKILQEKQESNKLQGKQEETKSLQREEQGVQGSQQVLGSKEEVMHSLVPLNTEAAIVPAGQLEALGSAMKAATALDLARTPGSLGAARVLTVPQSREKDPARNPECSLNGPIGMCLLKNGCFVVASSFDDKVKMFSGSGKFLKLVKPTTEAGFERPTDMVCLRCGILSNPRACSVVGQISSGVASSLYGTTRSCGGSPRKAPSSPPSGRASSDPPSRTASRRMTRGVSSPSPRAAGTRTSSSSMSWRESW